MPSSASRTRSEKVSPAPIDELQAVRKNRRYEQVAEQIQGLIARGVLKAGDRLPPERELVAKFGVGRGSIRDAIRTLEVMGIVEPRQGHGTVVRELSAESLVVPLASVLSEKRHLVGELLDVRRMIEPALANRAARNATPEEIAGLEDILRRQQAKVRRGGEGRPLRPPANGVATPGFPAADRRPLRRAAAACGSGYIPLRSGRKSVSR